MRSGRIVCVRAGGRPCVRVCDVPREARRLNNAKRSVIGLYGGPEI